MSRRSIEKITQRKIDRRREENSKNLPKSKEKNDRNQENLLKIEEKVQGQNASILIDSEASKDFIDEKFSKEMQLKTKKGNYIDLNPRINWKNNKIIIKKDNQIHKITAEAKDTKEYQTKKTEKETQTERVSSFLKKLVEQYQDIFPEEIPNELLPERNVDYEILFQEGMSLPYRPIYKMSILEMK
ncbi:2948_t:CDS:2, partial [Cetraspora pellucida]